MDETHQQQIDAVEIMKASKPTFPPTDMQHIEKHIRKKLFIKNL